jgi:hypothetical protein
MLGAQPQPFATPLRLPEEEKELGGEVGEHAQLVFCEQHRVRGKTPEGTVLAVRVVLREAVLVVNANGTRARKPLTSISYDLSFIAAVNDRGRFEYEYCIEVPRRRTGYPSRILPSDYHFWG